MVKEEEEEEAEEAPKTLKEQLLCLVASPCSSTPDDAVAEAEGPVEPEGENLLADAVMYTL